MLQDERLSSHEAESRLAQREKDWRVRKKQIDAAAAAIILQDYLDTVSAVPIPTLDDPDL
jgi:putative Holliday junction resolvase